jgi:hypothetical protein
VPAGFLKLVVRDICLTAADKYLPHVSCPLGNYILEHETIKIHYAAAVKIFGDGQPVFLVGK